MVTVRFAPSPTGRLHIGNARTALFNWLYAHKLGGRFVLRLDDTDAERSEQRYADAIQTDLAWLGISADVTAHQSARFDHYRFAMEKLRERGLLYPCYETPEELERRRKLRLGRGLPPVYGREALKLTDEDRARLEAEGRKPHWRFLLPNFEDDPMATRRTEIGWRDLVRGEQSVDLASMSDPVLVRGDGTWLYTLPSVVDDIEMGVTHVIRGDDHVTNTGVQLALFDALDGERPVFGHHNLLTTTGGEGLSKRSGALSLGALHDEGYEPMAVASLAVLIGTSRNVQAHRSLDSLAAEFDPAISTKSAAKFDPHELVGLNRDLVHAMDYAEVKDRLSAIGIGGVDAASFWLAVRANLNRVPEAELWWRVLTEGPQEEDGLEEGDVDFVRTAFDRLPPEPWDSQTWKRWTDTVKEQTGRKGKKLFMPLRIALTGLRSGPELADLLPLLGRERTMARRP